MTLTLNCARLLLSLALLATCSSRAADAPKGDEPPGPPEGARIYTNLLYVANGTERQRLDLYLPAKGTNLPLIVWVHGGAWSGHSKAQPEGLAFLNRGYAMASINYRLSQHAIWPAQIIDCKAAIRWLRAHAAEYGIDPNHIGAWGWSAGGHLVAMLGTTGDVKDFDQGDNLAFSSRVQAVGDWFGPTDMLQVTNYLSEIKWGTSNSPDTRLLGGLSSQNVAKAESANPIRYITKNTPPFLILHGTKDPQVPLAESQMLFDALQKAGVPVSFHMILGGGHGGPGFRAPEVEGWLYDFFDKNLKGAPAASSNTGDVK